jgi:N-acetylglucosamine-6-phosphate deacetylase
MICLAKSVESGRPVAIDFDTTINSVQPTETDPGDLYVAPGFIDLQVNGFAGVDFNDPNSSLEQIGKALDAILATGVTCCLPTVITGPPAQTLASLRNLDSARTSLPRGRMIAGFHVEGPHIDATEGPRGAHPAACVRPPDLDEFGRWQDATGGNIRLVTLSPHWPDAPRYIASLKEAGVAVSIGHTGASSQQIAAAVDAGAVLSTHLGNAAHKTLPKFPNYLFDQMADDRLSASFIADGIHLDDAFFQVALRAKTIARTILVTDAAAPAGTALTGAHPGRYRLGELEVELTADNRVVLIGTKKLAGSALRMDAAITNLMRIGALTLRDAIRAATNNPAQLLGLPGRTKGLAVGERADLVVFRQSPAIEIKAVYLDGELVTPAA